MPKNKHAIIAVVLLCVSFLGAGGSAYAMRAMDSTSTTATPSVVDEPMIPEADRHVDMPILVYHSVRPAEYEETHMQQLFTVYPNIFRQQLSYLRDNGYSVITLSHLESFLTQGTPLPRCPVVITFDDSWENQYTYAFPILKEFSFSALFYLIIDAVDDPAYLTWSQVQEMAAGGMQFGSHTRTHPNLAQEYDNDTLRNEIVRSKEILETRLGLATSSFAYPYGAYNDETVQIVQDAGYTSGRSFTPGLHHAIEDLGTLKGIRVPNDMQEFIGILPVCEE